MFSDHIVAQQANRYIVAFHIAISQYPTIRSGFLITGGLYAYRIRAACVVSFDGPQYALTSALQRVKHTE